jgi:hypothetical protein
MQGAALGAPILPFSWIFRLIWQQKPRLSGVLALHQKTVAGSRYRPVAAYSSRLRISASRSPRRLVKRAAAAPLITR